MKINIFWFRRDLRLDDNTALYHALKRDNKVTGFLESNDIRVNTYKDQVIFETNEITKDDGKPYSIYTPYKRKWLERYRLNPVRTLPPADFSKLCKNDFAFPPITKIGFRRSPVKVRDYDLTRLDDYPMLRDIPGEDATSCLSPHLRFGTVSIRHVIRQLKPEHDIFLGELIWREFFMQILWHFPEAESQNFNAKYNGIDWRNDQKEYRLWCLGKTGYPIVEHRFTRNRALEEYKKGLLL